MSSAKWILDPERRITHPSLPSMAAAPPGMIFVMKIPGSSGICGLSTPPAMLNPRPELPYRWHAWEEYYRWRNADVSQRFVNLLFERHLARKAWTVLWNVWCAFQESKNIFRFCLFPPSILHHLLFSFQCQKAETGWSVWQSHLKRQALKQTAEKRLHFIIFYN